MDGRAMALSQRRRLIGEAVELEREREAALLVQLEERFAELEGPALDDEVLAGMTPEDADIVRAVLRDHDPDEGGPRADLDEEWLAVVEGDAAPDESSDEDDADLLLVEIARLEQEIALSRRRRDAYERYAEALGA